MCLARLDFASEVYLSYYCYSLKEYRLYCDARYGSTSRSPNLSLTDSFAEYSFVKKINILGCTSQLEYFREYLQACLMLFCELVRLKSVTFLQDSQLDLVLPVQF